jgi:D-beta-D-heptose 7-phosphate kinase/D-beta-D-heptose 1-phosphate adenosyltransferase
MDKKRVILLNELLPLTAEHKRHGLTVVFTNGCFDLLHVGHIRYLTRAKSEGDILVVGLNSDRSVRALKGPDRPVQRQEDRAEILAALRPVDYVVIFDEQTPIDLIGALRPDILVKGEDWEEEDIVGAREVKSWGGKVVRASFTPGASTTTLIERMKK